jgi:thymidylate synthase ThyX
MTANFREWRLILQQRCSKRAHPDMQLLMNQIRSILIENWAPVFEDLAVVT